MVNYCPSCGKKLPASSSLSKFCQFCGESLSPIATANKQNQAVTQDEEGVKVPKIDKLKVAIVGSGRRGVTLGQHALDQTSKFDWNRPPQNQATFMDDWRREAGPRRQGDTTEIVLDKNEG